MFKKFILASALMFSASFASWDLFPVLEKHKGEAMVSINEQMVSDFYVTAFIAGARFTVIDNLELGLKIPCVVYAEINDVKIDMSGLGNLTFLARYQFLPTMNAFVDVEIPVGDKSYNAKNVWTFTAGAQFSTTINDRMIIGSELSTTISTKGDYNFAPWDLNAGLELEFSVLPQFSPYFGSEMHFSLGEFVDGQGYQYSHGGGEVGFSPIMGAKYSINNLLTIDTSARFTLGEHYYGTHSVTLFSVAALFKF